ncbi:MAG: hypothetical protein ACFFAN_04215 [Promethearchaeota archaeon]
MDKQRILKEAQRIAAKFSFWMVSGNIAHLYGYIHDTSEKKYDLEIKFDENFPIAPPQLIYYDAIKELLGDFKPKKLIIWTPESVVVDILHELKFEIQKTLNKSVNSEEKHLIPSNSPSENQSQKKIMINQSTKNNLSLSDSEDYITPDLESYPPDFDYKKFNPQLSSDNDLFYSDWQTSSSSRKNLDDQYQPSILNFQETNQEENFEEKEQISVAASTELRLIQQYYAYDQKGDNPANINVYLTITITKTFIIGVSFTNYPKKPIISFSNEVKSILGDPYQSLESLKKWIPKNPIHIVDVLHEIEKKLLFIKDIELESNKILSEYQCDTIANNITQLRVHLLTYGFKEYILEIDLRSYPKFPEINLIPELQRIIQVPITSLNSYKNWKKKESEPIQIIREISWLVDKNSRINFEIELLKEHYKNIKYDAITETLRVDMKGKMKTQDLTFEFQINLPREYPMKMPEIKILNEFELETHEQIKSNLQSSFKDFFDEWMPFNYLVDLFNLISKKIFEVSVIACVICHKIECPICLKNIAGKESCYAECPYCERTYHKHCWEQTIKSFGKCGFCLKTPPSSMIL